ncbi:hypothetical protein THAOC_27976 [Thalassiosira oceanica]|uniref:Plastid lipid-associated protein/fibrillin conserved domain-containing protein n=1 Tax=Thalassiosira oceanica TaxID=159749 RepID=K0S1K0_THAOC|nr:hypothetical protein THAOC_27976 [Thalassiosira oceanica]|eukprot:EJK52722.1 hypothetical protein THAOC_27976 [Thalassiosira oceanica]
MSVGKAFAVAVVARLLGASLALTTMECTRRGVISRILGVASSASVCVLKPSYAAVDVREYTALAPLGRPSTTGDKCTGLSLSQLSERLTNDLQSGSTGRGGYFISGDISADIFRDDCAFVDPTNSVSSLSRYRNALAILFDPQSSFVELLAPLEVDETHNQISANIRSGGVLQLPWGPRIAPYESKIVYTVDQNGLIESQYQEWSISAAEALRETFSLNSAPYSAIARPKDEPVEVTELFNLVNARRTDSYSQEERYRIASLIDSVACARYPWARGELAGTWALVYLQPGPDGGTIDRRIPFPDLPFNNNYQIFGDESVTNVGELLGPALKVRVSGSLREEDTTSLSTPKRFRAEIEGGGLCVGEDGGGCLPLPIRGEGIFDGVYLGKRLRIGQNINGGGARVVQVRVQ